LNCWPNWFHRRAIALLVNPNSPTAEPTIRTTQEAARAKGMQLSILQAGSESEIDAAFTGLANRHADALVVGADPFFDTRRERVVAPAARYGIPTIYDSREFTESGGLISYGTNLAAVYR
jgi:putative ABC transport system substrate-binding protein